MRNLTLLLILLAVLASASAASVRTEGLLPVDGSETTAVLTSAAPSAAKSDTVYLLGGPGRWDGTFQTEGSTYLPDWHGWYGVDLTERSYEIWHVDTFNSPTGTSAAWCGELFASCGTGDPAEGYGNGYEEFLVWRGVVADGALPVNVTVTFDLNYDNEPGYDYLYLEYETDMGWQEAAVYNGSTYDSGSGAWVPLLGETASFTIPGGSLVGAAGNEVHLRFQAMSDGAWSDADCLWPTSGHSQVDNIAVSGDNGLAGTYDDFEGGDLGNWELEFPTSVGDFSKIWPYLHDLDPCVDNETCQVAFIDDGVVVPCTGGTLGITWTYGPGSYIHNLTGGCLGPGGHVENEVWSAAIAYADEAGTPLAATHEGAQFAFTVYPHLPISNGLFWVWHVQSSTDGGATWPAWADRNFVHYGDTSYQRVHQTVSDLMQQNATHVRVALGIYEIGWIWGFVGTDGTPAPYFDNVSFKVYAIDGPQITTRELQLAQDSFPTIGDIDLVDLGANDIRFDMANDILGDRGSAVLPGDSITFDITAIRSGSVLNSRPRLYYSMKANPLFDPYRLHATSGYVEGDTVYVGSGAVVPDRWSFDLPDEDFFYPGDMIHYYIWAEDDQAGDIGVTTMPAALDGFGVFPGEPGYVSMLWPQSFIVRGLPSIDHADGRHPDILFWNDFGDRGGTNEWLHSFHELGLQEGIDYDIYYTNAPSSGVSNGLGSRASLTQIDGYESIFYTSGNLSAYTICGLDLYGDKSDDIGLLDSWLLGGGNLMITGDGVASDLVYSHGSAGAAFLSNHMSVTVQGSDVSQLLGGMISPTMVPVSGNQLFLDQEVIAYGSCPTLNYFDAIVPTGSAEAVMEWEGHSGLEVAGVLNETASSRVATFPVGFSFWWTPQGYTPPPGAPHTAARTTLLSSILTTFGHIWYWVDADLPAVLSAEVAPNPFNPLTEIRYTVPSRGPVSVRVYNVRGELVRTLVDEDVEAGAHSVRWQGRDDRGSSAASGVYFYEVRTGGEAVVGKMSLVR